MPQRQILRSGVGFKRLNKILLTHSHLDHILGLGGLVSTFASWEEMSELEIWGGKPTLDRVRSFRDRRATPALPVLEGAVLAPSSRC